MSNIQFEKTGITSWGQKWHYQFPQEVSLLTDIPTPNFPHQMIVLVTDLHTLDEDNFEDIFGKFGTEYPFYNHPEQEKEWNDLCFRLWTEELDAFHSIMRQVYPAMRDLILSAFENPDESHNAHHPISSTTIDAVLNGCLKVIKDNIDTSEWSPETDDTFMFYLELEIRGMARKLGRWDESMKWGDE